MNFMQPLLLKSRSLERYVGKLSAAIADAPSYDTRKKLRVRLTPCGKSTLRASEMQHLIWAPERFSIFPDNNKIDISEHGTSKVNDEALGTPRLYREIAFANANM